jgi:hypothetical protein
VSGPVASRVTGAGDEDSAAAIQSIAWRRSGVRLAGAVEAAHAMHISRQAKLPDERPPGPGRDGHVRAPGIVEDPDRVRRRLVDRLVTGHGRHAEQLHLVARQRQEQRDRVVVAGVAVDDDRRHPPDTTRGFGSSNIPTA